MPSLEREPRPRATPRFHSSLLELPFNQERAESVSHDLLETLISYAMPLLITVSSLVAVLGDTWAKDAKRLTPTGITGR